MITIKKKFGGPLASEVDRFLRLYRLESRIDGMVFAFPLLTMFRAEFFTLTGHYFS